MTAGRSPAPPRLVVDRPGDGRHGLVVGDAKVDVLQRSRHPSPGHEVLELEIVAAGEVRFAIEALVPADCANACVTLNGEVLVDWFSDVFPKGADDPRLPRSSACPGCSCGEGETRRVSTLRPGRRQALVLRWLPGDVLRFHFLR